MALPQWETGAAGPELPELNPWDVLILGGIKLPGRVRLRARRGRKCDRKSPRGVDGETFTDQGSKVAELEILITVWGHDQLEDLVAKLDRLLPVPKKAVPPANQAVSGPLNANQKAAAAQWIQDRLNGSTAPLPDSAINAGGLTPEQKAATATEVQLWLDGKAPFPLTQGPPPPKGDSLRPLSIVHPSLARLRIRSVMITEEENFQPGPEVGTFEWRARAVEWMAKSQTSVLATPTGATNDAVDLTGIGVAEGLPVEPTPPSRDPSVIGP